MTGWIITPGYPDSHSLIEIWTAIIDAVIDITYKELISEYKGPIEETNDGCPLDMAIFMTEKQGRGLSVTIDEDARVVRLLASGGGKERRMKEHMRRAFIRCLLRRTADFNVDITSG